MELRSQQPGEWVQDFCTLPDRVREGNSRVGLLPAEIWGGFLEMGSRLGARFWVAYEEGRAVGRIGANLLSDPGAGAFGFFEVDATRPNAQGIARSLIGAAREWLQSQGVHKMVGPLNFNTWFPYRFRTTFDDPLVFSWEPNNPREYVSFLQENGFVPCEVYHSEGVGGLKGYIEKTQVDYDRALSKGYTFRPFDGTQILEKEVPILHRLSLLGFAENYLFEPIDLATFRSLYVPIAKKMDFSHAFFAVSPAGEEVGYFFCFVDQGYLVLKSVVIHPEHRGVGLSNALTYLAAKQASSHGVEKYLPALIRVGIRSESYAKKGERLWRHEYTLYEQRI